MTHRESLDHPNQVDGFGLRGFRGFLVALHRTLIAIFLALSHLNHVCRQLSTSSTFYIAFPTPKVPLLKLNNTPKCICSAIQNFTIQRQADPWADLCLVAQCPESV